VKGSERNSPRAEWAGFHGETESWRKKLVGDISDAFIIPRYVRLFYQTFGHDKQLDLCEIGSGNGDTSAAILSANKSQIRRYVTSEVFPEGVQWLRNRGVESVLADAQSLPWADGEFDAAVEFDVMHHVDNPAAMAGEMMRVARGRLLLVESNGMSIFRRLRELTPAHRQAGERSYSPWQYRNFFSRNHEYEIVRFEIAPFLFPFKCPRWFLPAMVAFNRLIEHVPIIRWCCSSVWMRVQYRRVGG
jgi:ubiquinone/menaquinone biosynthesis C-methylase UbiE